MKPGGRLVYVTCSLLAEENEDRMAACQLAAPAFAVVPTLKAIEASGRIDAAGLAMLAAHATAPDSCA